MTATPELLDKLLRSGAPSGYEGPAAEVWRGAASFAELSSDGLGSSIARVGDASPLLAVVGHIDEIGLLITHIDEKGFLWFAPIGGWDPQILVGQRVEVRTRDGDVPGVVGRKPIHLLEAEQRKKVVELKSMHIDIGAADGEEAEAMVRVGDPVVIATEPQPLAGERLVSRAMDNRLGAYV
ncbi:MAG TPA: M42 family peptidase, partial [Solirubrobacterales bacterium]|nr:M42 family peptidase [Solirubrobacterales bacterium]